MLSDSVIVTDGNDTVNINDVTEIISPVISESVISGESNRDTVQVTINNDAFAVSELAQAVSVTESLTVQPVITEGSVIKLVKEPNSFTVSIPALTESTIDSQPVNTYGAAVWEVSVLDEVSFKIKYFTVAARWRDSSIFFIVSHIFGDTLPTPCTVEISAGLAVFKLNNTSNHSFKVSGVRTLINN